MITNFRRFSDVFNFTSGLGTQYMTPLAFGAIVNWESGNQKVRTRYDVNSMSYGLMQIKEVAFKTLVEKPVKFNHNGSVIRMPMLDFFKKFYPNAYPSNWKSDDIDNLIVGALYLAWWSHQIYPDGNTTIRQCYYGYVHGKVATDAEAVKWIKTNKYIEAGLAPLLAID